MRIADFGDLVKGEQGSPLKFFKVPSRSGVVSSAGRKRRLDMASTPHQLWLWLCFGSSQHSVFTVGWPLKRFSDSNTF